ncbi:hypothetical protein AGMMS50218_11600 [Actinomycetota bacterium]|nr:hypothetical protein AGMMS50218_11600 [Actinomycetota bacterium]
MTRYAEPAAVQRALLQRLRQAARVLLGSSSAPPVPATPDDPAAESAALLHELVTLARTSGRSDVVWLLLVAVSARFPTDDGVRTARRRLELAEPADGELWLLERGLGTLGPSADPLTEIDLVTGGVLVDVDFSARHDLNTGIQRVVRSTMPVWTRDHDLTLVVWTAPTALRLPDQRELARVLHWSDRESTPALAPTPRTAPPATGTGVPAAPPRRIVVPWRSVLVLSEVPAPDLCAPVAALAEHSGNVVTAIGYDCIPVVSADMMPPVEPNRFVRYLTILKHARRISGISASATAEFQGYSHMLPAQGLTGPDVVECLLPVEVPAGAGTQDPAGPSGAAHTGPPLVVVVGSHEPRKNHLAVLHAAERLWREGREFRLQFIGGSSWASGGFDDVVTRLRRAGRAVTVGRAVGDGELWAAYRAARFTVFPSLHEGFGLPVAESLAVGTPAITSSFGSTEEISRDGGTLLVDPRDDDALTEAMRRLLTDDALVARLHDEAVARPARTWEDYGRELWQQLVDDVRVAP